MISAEQVELIETKYEALKVELDDQSCRLLSEVEANSLGYGGIAGRASLKRGTVKLETVELNE